MKKKGQNVTNLDKKERKKEIKKEKKKIECRRRQYYGRLKGGS